VSSYLTAHKRPFSALLNVSSKNNYVYCIDTARQFLTLFSASVYVQSAVIKSLYGSANCTVG